MSHLKPHQALGLIELFREKRAGANAIGKDEQSEWNEPAKKSLETGVSR